jgi:hypothetical protein
MSLPVIIALDLATKAGVAIGRPGERPVLTTAKLRRDPTDNDIDIFAYALRWVERLVDENDAGVVALEQPVAIHDSRLLFGLRGIAAAAARRGGARVIEATVGEWRAYALGTARLKGPVAKERCVDLVRRLKWDAPDHNAAEAAMIWLWGCSCIAPKLVQRAEPLFLPR